MTAIGKERRQGKGGLKMEDKMGADDWKIS